MSKYVCGKCHQGYEELQAFGDHICLGDNPVLRAFGNVINLGEYSIDMRQSIEDEIRKERVRGAVEGIEDQLRRGDLSA